MLAYYLKKVEASIKNKKCVSLIFEYKTWWRGLKSNIKSSWDMNYPDALAFTSKVDCVIVGYGVIGPTDLVNLQAGN
jgi:hypothetical protein